MCVAWSETQVSISASLLKLCLNAIHQQLPLESDFSFVVLFPPFSSGAKQFSTVWSWENQEMRVTGKRGRIPLTYPEISACVLLQLIIPAAAEQMERESPEGHSPHSERAGWERCEEPHELGLRSTTARLRKREKDLTPRSMDW